ncbi:Carboxypeptidase D, partial [Bertholletia excelsa]
IGNAVLNDETDLWGIVDYVASHALISDETWYQIHKYCDFSPNTNISDQCKNATVPAFNDVKHINIYNIYAPLCLSPNLTVKPKKASVLDFDPCSLNYVHAYLNRPEVQKALHANVAMINYSWAPCSKVLKWQDSPPTILPLLREIMANGFRLWVYSGDVGGVIPITSTKYSLKKLKLPVKTAWYPWFLDKEVGGYSEVYKGDLTLATVRGAGHIVPTYQPPRALSLIKHFLAGRPLPSSSSSS